MPAKENDFYIEASRYCDASPQTVKKYWEACVETIIRRMYLLGEVKMPGLGKMYSTIMPEKRQVQKDPRTGDYVEYVVPERIKPEFSAEDEFINDINGAGVTKQYRKRVKNKILTKRDLERIARTEEIENEKKLKPVPEELKKEMQERFLEVLEIKKNKGNKTNEKKSE